MNSPPRGELTDSKRPGTHLLIFVIWPPKGDAARKDQGIKTKNPTNRSVTAIKEYLFKIFIH
mgnify:CR=1